MHVLWCTVFCFALTALGDAEVLRWSKLVPAQKIGTPKNDGYKNVLLSDREFLDNFDHTVIHAWEMFKVNFKRKYKSAAELHTRLNIFTNHLHEVYIHNSRYAKGQVTYEMGVNEFSDKSEDELRHHRCFKLPQNYARSGSTYVRSADIQIPSSVDWRSEGAVTNVKDQGGCGSCYAFSATGALEGQNYMTTKTLIPLSEQQAVSCSDFFGNEGCNGGLMDNVFEYWKAVGGAQSEIDYPYTSGISGVSDVCRISKKGSVVSVTGYVDLPSGDEEALKEAVALHGPIAIGINAGLMSFSFYRKGIYSDPECGGSPDDLDHGVLLVGYGEENGVPYWLVKNSWGPNWGEQGYVKILRNAHNMCGVATAASYPLV